MSLGADALHVADVNDAALETGSLSLKLTKTGPDVRLDRFRVENLGGASVEAEGASGEDGISLAGHIRAGQLRDFAALVARLAPGPWTSLVAGRADLLSPAALAFEAHGQAGSVTTFSAKGSLGRTQAALSLEPGPRGSGQAIAASLDAPDTAALLRQLGLPASDQAKSGSAHVTLDAAGTFEGGYDVNGAATLAGVDLSGRGRFLPQAQGDDARLFGSVKAKGANVAPLLATLGFAPQGGPALGPADASADLTLRGDDWAVSKLAASVAGVKAKGEFTYHPAAAAAADALAAPDISRALEAVGGPGAPSALPSHPEIAGELSLDRLSLGGLVSLVLGPPAPPKPGDVWSDAKFAAPPLNLPRASIRLSVGALSLMDGSTAQSFQTRLGLDKGRLELGEIGASWLGGSVSGHATLRRIGESATLSGALGADRLAIRRTGFVGEVGGALDFASTGRNPAALIAGLAGSGNVRFAGAELMRSDPAALGRVVARAQEPDAQLDETNIGFFLAKELDKAPAVLPEGTAPAALSAGALKMGPIALPGPQGQADVTATFDLRSLSLDTGLRLVSPSDKLKFWSGPPPAASVTVQDALHAPRRKVDASSLSAGLATQAIARETDRIANMEADIRERAFFNRRLKGLQTLDRNEKELQDFLTEQQRLKGLSQRLEAERAEEARIAAEKAAAEKAAAEKAAAERAAAEKAAAEKAAAERAAAERAEAERKAAAERAVRPQLPPDIPPVESVPRPPAAPAQSERPDESGSAASHLAPLPPSRPKPPPEPPAPAVPTAGGLY